MLIYLLIGNMYTYIYIYDKRNMGVCVYPCAYVDVYVYPCAYVDVYAYTHMNVSSGPQCFSKKEMYSCFSCLHEGQRDNGWWK